MKFQILDIVSFSERTWSQKELASNDFSLLINISTLLGDSSSKKLKRNFHDLYLEKEKAIHLAAATLLYWKIL